MLLIRAKIGFISQMLRLINSKKVFRFWETFFVPEQSCEKRLQKTREVLKPEIDWKWWKTNITIHITVAN